MHGRKAELTAVLSGVEDVSDVDGGYAFASACSAAGATGTYSVLPRLFTAALCPTTFST